jgi:hypothetical protein
VRNVVAVCVAVVSVLCQSGAWAIKHSPPREAARHPEAVLITAKDAHSPRSCISCGVLLSPTVVLTVAHGVAGFESWEVKAPYARERTRQARGKIVRINPDYKPGDAEGDLALLTLDRAIDIDGDWPALPGTNLYALETPLVVVGRVAQGKISSQQLFEASTTLVAVRGDTNLYGGHPQICELGDSGGPVYLAARPHQLVGLMCGSLGSSRANVPTDIYVPLGGRNKEWIANHVPRRAETKAKP